MRTPKRATTVVPGPPYGEPVATPSPKSRQPGCRIVARCTALPIQALSSRGGRREEEVLACRPATAVGPVAAGRDPVHVVAVVRRVVVKEVLRHHRARVPGRHAREGAVPAHPAEAVAGALAVVKAEHRLLELAGARRRRPGAGAA